MPINDVMRAFTMFADGFGKLGDCSELGLPKITVKSEEFRPGGADVPVEVDLGLEKLEATFTLSAFDAQIMGLVAVGPGNDKQFTFRGSLASEDGTEKGVLVKMTGSLAESDPGSWKAGDAAELKGRIAIKYYKLAIGDAVIHEIDINGLKRVINGVDVLAQRRINLGL